MLFLCPFAAAAEMAINAQRVATPPVVDGNGNDAVWRQTKPVLINDQTANETILLSSVYTSERVYFLVQFVDKAENLLHKPWMWDMTKKRYEEGPHREDTFLFKWNMEEQDVNLSTFSDDDYRADLWYWKANRSNLAGFADDKMQILSGRDTGDIRKDNQEVNEIKKLHSFSGRLRWLTRISDTGEAPYREVARPARHTGQVVPRFIAAQPSGSRADVQARGRWSGGYWTLEFSRSLKTGKDDDIQFDPTRKYLFGVSIFSLYGNAYDVSSPNLYGMGRISEPLRLSFL